MSRQSDSNDPLPSLSNAEWEVMKVVWDAGQSAARDVYAALPEDHGWAYKTVKTLLARLVTKGALDYVQVGNSYLYRPVYPRDEMMRKEVRGFVDRVFDGAATPGLAHFLRDTSLSSSDIDQLRSLRDEKEKEARRKEKGGRS